MRYVYLFHEGNARMKELLGGKGANLAEMTNIGLPVPCGMTITTDACREYYNNGKKLPEGLVEEVTRNLKASASGTRMIPCCSRSVPVRSSPCPA